MHIRQREVLRYLGYHGHPADERTQAKIEQGEALLMSAAVPHAVWETFPLEVEAPGVLKIGRMRVQSGNLFRHLRGCTGAVLFAATLGARVDALMARYAKADVTLMVILQAAAAELIESYCDDRQEEIAREAAQKGLYLRPRFSPGYGDFDIHHQKDFIELLACPKRIGLTMTDSFMLAPSKSVTAVIGLTPEKQSCHIDACAACTKKDCAFRKEA